MKLALDIENLLEPVITNLGYELWGVEYLQQGKHSLLRIFIDSPAGITLQDCERVSREVSARLDVEDPVSGFYNLEVSSPGIPRQIFKPSQYMRYIGSLVQLKLHTPVAGKRQIKALLVSVQDHGVSVEVNHEQMMIPFSQIVKGSVSNA